MGDDVGVFDELSSHRRGRLVETATDTCGADPTNLQPITGEKNTTRPGTSISALSEGEYHA